MRRPRDDAGGVSLIAVFGILGLAALAVLAISTGSIYLRWAQLSHAVETARQSTMSAGFQMRLKNEEVPGDALAGKFITELRRAGVDEETLVLFQESQDPDLGPDVRAMALTARVVATFKPVTFLDAMDIPVTTTLSVIPYAESHVYKPESTAAHTGSVRSYAYAEGSTQANSADMQPGDADKRLLQATLDATVEKAKTM